ncbi:MAG: hypothetical protein KKH88_01880 [Nanoarchaeota archaeon]|nr:hypothetical protein [Nanoarchaeota archaeon]MBU1445296.1 hypothetical protein [Nanoarchaeota archaeon]MBU2406673.1 hypothetical protein [Nanoarchaeota archaeon]MBU2420492.1 hypothetical protein [Nanoarchaeota archaeon]MBU2475083.1 hypothetical protein [Nanoarchaeota archaeon]
MVDLTKHIETKYPGLTTLEAAVRVGKLLDRAENIRRRADADYLSVDDIKGIYETAELIEKEASALATYYEVPVKRGLPKGE